VEPNNLWERWSQTTFGKGGAKQPLGKVEPNNLWERFCSTFLKSRFWFYLFLKGKFGFTFL